MSRNQLMRILLPGILLVLLSALISGVMLSGAPRQVWLSRAAVLVHLVTGLGAVVPLFHFLRGHWWRRRDRIERHPNARFGYVAAVTLLVLLLSGIGLLRWTSWAPLGYLHGGAALVLTADLGVHATWRWRRRRRIRRSLPAGVPPGVAIMAGVLLIAGGGYVGLRAEAAPAVSVPQPPPIPVVHDAFHGAGSTFGEFPTAAACAECHTDLGAGWAESAHAHAARDPYYQALATLFIQERGVEAARYCARCHNPMGLMNGEIALGAATATSGDDAPAYQARVLGVELPMSHAAAEGVTCVVCHRALLAEGQEAVMLQPLRPLLDDAVGRLALRALPDLHRSELSPDVLDEAALCGSCHNLATPDGVLLEPTYDEWLNSPYPAEGVTCQACHMPESAVRGVNSAMGGVSVAHGGMPGSPSSLPGVSDGTALLRQAATVDIVWEPAGVRQGTLLVRVTNSGAGHYLPTGADDLRQVWLEVTVRDVEGDVVWRHGALTAGDRLPEDVIQFRKVLGDARGRPVDLHRFWVASQVLEDTRLAPRETRNYQFDITFKSAADPFTATARLLYRDVPPAFAEFARGEPVIRWSPLEMAVAALEVP